MKKHQHKALWLGLIVTGLGLMAMLFAVSGTQAQGPALPTATPNSPPPANPGNGNTNEDSDDDDDESSSPPAGAYIEVHVQNAPAGTWSVVQWQDTNGNWHTVEGWQGKLDDGYQRWWVHPKDFDTGPFRWGIFNAPNSSVITSSDPFTLPLLPNQTVRVELKLR